MTANSADSLFKALGEALLGVGLRRMRDDEGDYRQLSQWLTDECVPECDDSRQKSAFLGRSFGR